MMTHHSPLVLQEELADVCGEGSYGDKMAQIREEIEKQHE